jgi:hypothetical protein
VADDDLAEQLPVSTERAAVPYTSSPELLVLHGVRVKGMADGATVARRFGLDRDGVEELLRPARPPPP